MNPAPKVGKLPARAVWQHVFVVILAGGSGTRFWPLSRRVRPKQLLEFLGGPSLLVQTVQRIHGLVSLERIVVLTNTRIRASVQRELAGFPGVQIVAEPASRNTAPAIGLAAFEIARRDPDAVMMVLPSDQLVTKPGMFRRAAAAACRLAQKESASVVIGITPSRPETGYGYIRLGPLQTRRSGWAVYRVLQFTEKPAAAVAKRYVRSGRYLWNAGMFIWRASTVISNLERFQPAMAATLRRIADAGGIQAPSVLNRLYPRLENISIDYALMEKIPAIHAVAADLGWSDVGSWAALYDLSRKDPEGNARPGPGLCIDAHSNMVYAPEKFVALVGVEDLVVVETSDALLVCSRHRSQDVGKVARQLERQRMISLI
jgi:mannose-1-phosphate guanylyltransferase